MADLTAALIALPEEELTSLITRVTLARENEALRLRLPKVLTRFASNLRITTPTEKVSIEQDGGAHGCYCSVDRRTVVITAVIPNHSSDSSEAETNDTKPVEKQITVEWGKWKTYSNYLTGSASSDNHFVSLWYGKPLNKARYDRSSVLERRRMRARRKSAKAFSMSYGDPGSYDLQMRHGGIKELVHAVVQDLHGGTEVEEKFDEVEIIEAFLGSDAGTLLDNGPEEMTTLREVIEKDIDRVE